MFCIFLFKTSLSLKLFIEILGSSFLNICFKGKWVIFLSKMFSLICSRRFTFLLFNLNFLGEVSYLISIWDLGKFILLVLIFCKLFWEYTNLMLFFSVFVKVSSFTREHCKLLNSSMGELDLINSRDLILSLFFNNLRLLFFFLNAFCYALF